MATFRTRAILPILTFRTRALLPILTFALLLSTQRPIKAQIGSGNLTLNIDNVSVQNGGSNQTGTNVTPGTSLSGSVNVNGVTGNGGTTSVACNDSIAGQLYSQSFTSSGYGTFSYTPAAGQHSIPCTAQYSGTHANGTVTTAVALVPVEYVSVVDPLYKVTSILYATPGNVSSDSFMNTTTNGTTTMIGHSFQAGTTANFSFGWKLGSTGITLGNSITTGNTSAFTETIADASSVSNASATSGPNTLSHNQDLFLIWLNPEVQLTGSSQDFDYTVHSQYQNGTEQQPDIVEVTAQSMQSNNGSTSIPLPILQRQYDPATGNYDLAGLGAVCHDQSQYQNNCPAGGQCGCVPSDFTGILSADPLLSTTTATNPLTVDTSGVSACAAPTAGNSCRYIPVPATSGSSVIKTTRLAGPTCSNCNRTINAFTQSDSTSTTQTFSETYSQSVAYSIKYGAGVGPSLTLGTSFMWTDTESAGSTNGNTNQIGYSLSSNTTNCSQDVLIYEDTIFHTFVTQQAPNNNSCQ